MEFADRGEAVKGHNLDGEFIFVLEDGKKFDYESIGDSFAPSGQCSAPQRKENYENSVGNVKYF